MGERLPVNIFNNIIPNSYVMLDDGSDASKWVVPAQWSFLPFDSISTGDAYGYFGKGLKFQVDSPGAARNCIAYRSLVSRNTNGNYTFGFTIRPDMRCYDLTSYDSATFAGRSFAITFGFQTVTGAFRTCQVYIHTRRAAAILDGIYRKVSIGNAGPTFFTDTGWEEWGLPRNLAAPGSNEGAMPWIRISAAIRDFSLISMNINGTLYTPNMALLTSAQRMYNFIRVDGAKLDVTGGAISTSWDIDQIWVSDNENIV